MRWSLDGSALLLLCRIPGKDPYPLEVWLYRLNGASSAAPLVTELPSDTVAGGFGFYGAHPSLFSLVAWSRGAWPQGDWKELKPVGFTLPDPCVFVTPGVESGQRLLWQVDCGPGGYRDARGVLGAALAAQGWATCGSGLASASWRKGDYVLSVSEAAGPPAGYIGLTQSPSRIVTC